jgi:phenylacetate-CoA ligase
MSFFKTLSPIYGYGLKHLILPLGDMVMGQQMMKRLRFLEQAQWWNREKILNYRDGLLQKAIRDAYETSFYRDLMLERGIHPNDIRSAEDLKALPVVTKAMLRPEIPSRATRETGQKTYTECSSGSTGEPFCVQEDNFTAGWYRATFMLALQWAGWHFGDPHLQTGMTLARHNGRRVKDLLMLCNYQSAYDLSDKHLDEILDELAKYEIKHLWGYPGSLFHIAKRALETGRKISLNTVITWGDMVYPYYRQTIKEAFGVNVTDTYGCAEGMQISAQADGSDYYLVHNFDVVVEYLDDKNLPVPAGQAGNLVLTRLHAGATPFVRYKVGDMAISGGDRLSPCGRGFEIMESIQGRDTDIIITPSGNRLIVHFFTGILEHYSEIASFQVLQDKAEEITLKIVPNPNFNESVAEKIIQNLKQKGADIPIVLELVDNIPLTKGGKRRFVINTLSKQELLRDVSS